MASSSPTKKEDRPYFRLTTDEQGVATWIFYVPLFIMEIIGNAPLTVYNLFSQTSNKNYFKLNPRLFDVPHMRPLLYVYDFDLINFDEATLVDQKIHKDYIEVRFTQKLTHFITNDVADNDILDICLSEHTDDVYVFAYYKRERMKSQNIIKIYNQIKKIMPKYGLDPKCMKKIDSGSDAGFSRKLPVAGEEITVWYDRSEYSERNVIYKHCVVYRKKPKEDTIKNPNAGKKKRGPEWSNKINEDTLITVNKVFDLPQWNRKLKKKKF